MELKKTGGQAFPSSDGQTAHAIAAAAIAGISDSAERDRVYTEVHAQARQGMSLRDYFAGQAMQGMVTNPYCDSYSFNEYAEAAYKLADAMLAERAK